LGAQRVFKKLPFFSSCAIILSMSRRPEDPQLGLAAEHIERVRSKIEEGEIIEQQRRGREVKAQALKVLGHYLELDPEIVPERLLADRKYDGSWDTPYWEDIDYLPRGDRFESMGRLGTNSGQVVQERSLGDIAVKDSDWLRFGPKILDSFIKSLKDRKE
jgi:hypothetical protein